MSELPPGFQPHFRSSPATNPWEPLYSRRREDGALELLFDVRTAHCNGRGFLHGGVLAALCDNARGLTVGNTLGHPAPQIVTISLGVDYVGSAEIGARVTIAPRCLRAASGVSFCDALVTAGDRVIARANASFRVRLPESTERA